MTARLAALILQRLPYDIELVHADIKALNQSNDEKEIKSNNSASIEVSDEPTDNSLDDKLNGSSEPSNHATDKSLVDTRNT